MDYKPVFNAMLGNQTAGKALGGASGFGGGNIRGGVGRSGRGMKSGGGGRNWEGWAALAMPEMFQKWLDEEDPDKKASMASAMQNAYLGNERVGASGGRVGGPHWNGDYR
jgi:hypothetical protein